MPRANPTSRNQESLLAVSNMGQEENSAGNIFIPDRRISAALTINSAFSLIVCLRRVAANRGQLKPRLARPLFERRYLPYSDIELTPSSHHVGHPSLFIALAVILQLKGSLYSLNLFFTFSPPDEQEDQLETLGAVVHEYHSRQYGNKVRSIRWMLFHHDVDTHAEDLRIALATAAHVDADDLDIGPHKVRLAVQEQYLEGLAAIDDVVAVADIGFDKGSTQDVHEAFTGRVKKLYPLGRSTSGKTGHPDGHGTQVRSSVLGDGNSKSMGGRIRGIAAKSTLVVQSLLDGRGNLGGRQLPHDASSSEIDRFVWEHPDIVVLFAAGNDGMDIDRNGVIDDRLSSSCKELHHRRRKREPPPEHSYQVWQWNGRIQQSRAYKGGASNPMPLPPELLGPSQCYANVLPYALAWSIQQTSSTG
ncbi:protease [Coccidioides immitis RMSCC 2394]|uniref:Protease n=1 Tax=Coccidioides immitis RMSCC 2394 TaxID=404692 RepID=A0A0J6Y997_COCIT|nr:protease [Coccidioides immitis RMSCC 2394]